MTVTQNTGSFPIPAPPIGQANVSMAMSAPPKVVGAGTFASNAIDFSFAGEPIQSSSKQPGIVEFDEKAVAREIHTMILKYFADAQVSIMHEVGAPARSVRVDAILVSKEKDTPEHIYKRFDALTGELAARLTPGIRRFVDVDLSFG